MEQATTITASPEEQRVKPFEKAARIFCAKSGLDPDYVMAQTHPSIAGATVEIAFWIVIAEKMIDLSMMLTAMKEAAEQMPPTH